MSPSKCAYQQRRKERRRAERAALPAERAALLKAFDLGFKAQMITEGNMNAALDGNTYQRTRIECFRV